jgi:hypothetical protein
MTPLASQSEREAILEAIVNMNQRASREFPVVGTRLLPTPWDVRHQTINDLLDLLEMCE